MPVINDLRSHADDEAFCTGKIFSGNKIHYNVGREGYVTHILDLFHIQNTIKHTDMLSTYKLKKSEYVSMESIGTPF